MAFDDTPWPNRGDSRVNDDPFRHAHHLRRARAAWLHRPSRTHSAANRLLLKLAEKGLHIIEIDVRTLPSELLEGCDLLLFDASDSSVLDLCQTLSYIRVQNRAPLILLTDQHSPASNVEYLQAGADAILPLPTDENILFARCQALLRRWMATP